MLQQGGRVLTSGTPAPFAFGAQPGATLFIGDWSYRIEVPATATRLEVRVVTDTPGVDVDLYVRYGQDVAAGAGGVMADYRSLGLTGNETITITTSSTPRLQAGTYYIALVLYTSGVAASGSVRATLSSGGGGFTPGSAVGTWSWNVACAGGSFAGQFRIENQQADGTFGGLFLGTNATDVGSINGQMQGSNQISFTRTLEVEGQPRQQFWSGTMIRAGHMEGSISENNTRICTWAADLLDLGGGATQLNRNLLQNPGAEESPADAACAGGRTIPGWFQNGLPAVCRYGTTGSFPTLADPGPPERGSQFFAGGVALFTSLSQTADVSALGSLIDAGGIGYTLGGYLGGQGNQNDRTALRATFLSPSLQTLGTARIAPVTVDHRDGRTGLLYRQTTGPVPRGTQRIAVVVEFTRDEAPYNNAYADNLSLVLSGGGVGVNAPVLSVAPNLDFGSVALGQTADQSLLVRNVGTALLRITGIASSNAQFSLVTPAVPIEIAVAGERSLTLRFRPTGAGRQTSILTLSSNETETPTRTVELSGTGSGSTAGIAVDRTLLSFSTQPGVNPPPQTLGLRNAGSGTLNYRITSSQPWLSASPSTGSATGQTVSIQVLVNVTGLAPGEYSGQLTITESTGVAAAGPGAGQAAPATVTVRLTVGGTGCPAGPAEGPAIAAGGVVNAASFATPASPGGALARGSIFSLFGGGLGPNQPVVATQFPLGTTLGCVSLQVSLGATAVEVIPLMVFANQINALLPSNAPLGDATIRVSFAGRTSGGQTVRIVDSSPGIFTVNQSGTGPGILQNYVSATQLELNTRQRPARRRQVIIGWLTGLGPMAAPDNQPAPAGDLPVAVEVVVGGRPARKLYSGRAPGFAGLDQVNFEVPDDAPLGCAVPVYLRAGTVVSNTVTLAVSDTPNSCVD